MIVGVDFNVSVTSCIVKVLIVGFIYHFLSTYTRLLRGEWQQKDKLMAMVGSSS